MISAVDRAKPLAKPEAQSVTITPMILASGPCLIEEDGGRRFPLAAGQSWAIGRGDGCAVALESRSVSRLHALIQRREGGGYSLVDLGSLNGSFVNGRRVGFPVMLRDKDALLFGDRRLTFLNAAGHPQDGVLEDRLTAPTTAIHTHTLTTILVVDIRNFTPLVQQLSENNLSRTVGTWFLKVGNVAQRLGSWAQKYAGDAMMAVWVHDDPARLSSEVARALRAACEIDAVSRELGRAMGLPSDLRVGAGVNTGPALVGSADYAALGDTVNLAFRLESSTKELGADLALGDAGYQAMAPPRPPFVPRDVRLKGYDAPTRAWTICFEDLRRSVGARAAAV
jgi:adenylate cyclase